MDGDIVNELNFTVKLKECFADSAKINDWRYCTTSDRSNN